ncbi:hypothetical protein F4804DRAFT_164293 [Jackrogersella minutella]|nr:hypothetical protein F4804DRAFT_164293 [Jackrogersella minutella]
MLGERIVIDGLWRCLCPSIEVTTLARLISPTRTFRKRPAFTPSNAQVTCRQGRREYRRIPFRPDDGKTSQTRDDLTEQSRIQYLKRLAKRSPWVPGTLFEDTETFTPNLDKVPTRTIYAALKELSMAESTYVSVVKLVEYLVKERKEKPNAMLYESLIKANVDKYHGSAEVAGRLLREMQKLRITTTPQIYQSLLEVTAVHPDYVLRNTVLYEMRNRWFLPTTDDTINITIGLLRDNQYELALEKLEELQKDPTLVPTWLYEVFLYTFAELGFHEETLSILKHRLKITNFTNEPLSLNASLFLLDVFSRDAFYDGVKYIWDRSVSPGNLNPPDGVVMNILNAASNHADASLAISAIQMLSSRGRKLELHHYEPLIDIHTRQKDLQKAFTNLCIMAKAGLRPDLSSTRSIFRILRESSAETDNALLILNELRSKYRVPSAAFNVVLEATEIHGGFKAALDLYRSIRQFCADGPDLETYHILLSHCTMRKSMNFLFAEMKAFSIELTQVTYNHLIRISCMQDSHEQAFRFLEKMRTSKTAGLPNDWWLSKDSALALIRRCIQAEDIRVQGIIEECRKRNMYIDTEVQQLLDEIQRLKELNREDADALTEGELATEPEPDKVTSPDDDQTQKPNAISDWA